MQLHVRAAAAALGMTLACAAWAWPEKPIKLVVAAPAGGTMDIVAILQRSLEESTSRNGGRAAVKMATRGTRALVAQKRRAKVA